MNIVEFVKKVQNRYDFFGDNYVVSDIELNPDTFKLLEWTDPSDKIGVELFVSSSGFKINGIEVTANENVKPEHVVIYYHVPSCCNNLSGNYGNRVEVKYLSEFYDRSNPSTKISSINDAEILYEF